MSKNNNISNKIISERTRILREVRNLKSKEVAEQIGMHPRVYSSYETGEYGVDGEILSKLINVLDIDASYFFVDEEKAKNMIEEQLGGGFTILCREAQQKEKIKSLILDFDSIPDQKSKESLLNLIKTIGNKDHKQE